jgi:ribonuclease BN (tRNA processing enzyme)
VAQEAGVGQLILSHFYPIADRYDVKAQAGELYEGKIRKGRDLLTVEL